MPLVKDRSVTNQSQASFNFDKLADSYDRWYSSAIGSMYDRLEKKAFDSLIGNHKSGKLFLEIVTTKKKECRKCVRLFTIIFPSAVKYYA